MVDPVLSWGRAHRFSQGITWLERTQAPNPAALSQQFGEPMIARGLGRSYGDVALNENGLILSTLRYDNFLAADWVSGRIRAQAGLSIDELLRVAVPKGWFMPVTPGTKFVTLGGAVANDVHGKNHHVAGSLGAHILSLELLRSNGERFICSREENSELFALTIGGLGLTGLINWVELQLKPIASSNLEVENLPYPHLEDFFRLSEDSRDWPYTVAWVDCMAGGNSLGRGIFSRAREAGDGELDPHGVKAGLKWPLTTPGFLLNRLSITSFNWLYRHRPAARFKGIQPYNPFFYPLDGIREWNRLYGHKGFFQHQSLLPPDTGRDGLRQLLDTIQRAGQGSFLAVLKMHGPETSPGVMSFCREGVSLALDFANRGRKTRTLLARLDEIVAAHGGRLYPAKDGHMLPQIFQAAYPRWGELEAARDPNFSSSFWRRVTASGTSTDD